MKPILRYRLKKDNTYAVFSCNDDATGDLKIPKTHRGKAVTSIGSWAFYDCGGLTKQLPQNTCKTLAVKAFCSDMTCRGFQYEIGKEYHVNKAELCECGFHACTTGIDLFSYYYGKDNKDVVFCEVELSGITNEREYDSKVCGTSIKILRKLSIAEAANYCSVKEVKE